MRGPRPRPLIAPTVTILGICTAIWGCGRATPVPRPQKPPPVVMFVGDSFTVGSGPVPPWRAYAAESARLLGWQPVIAGAGGTGYLNQGRVGRTFRESFETELAWRPAPDLLVLSGGHNDRRYDEPEVRRAATELVRDVKARWPKTRIVMIGPIWLRDTPAAAYRVRDTLAGVARHETVTFLDPLDQPWREKNLVLPDGVHPTQDGHLRIARWLATALRSTG
jgi:acyl-CoA thioesterase-1